MRVGVTKEGKDTKPAPGHQNVEKAKSEPPKLKSIVSFCEKEIASLDDNWKKRLIEIIDEKDALMKELNEVSTRYVELNDLKEKLAQDFIVEKQARMEAEETFERVQQQLQGHEEDYNVLKNEFNALNEKNWGLESQLRKAHENLRLSEEIIGQEREHRIELQGRSQALGMALKAVL